MLLYHIGSNDEKYIVSTAMTTSIVITRRPRMLEAATVLLLCCLPNHTTMTTTTSPTTAMPRYTAKLLTIEMEFSWFGIGRDKVTSAIGMALDKVHSLYNDTIEFTWQWRPGACGPERVQAEAADVYYTTGFDIFIGPDPMAKRDVLTCLGYVKDHRERLLTTVVYSGTDSLSFTCSKACEALGYLSNSWNLPIITPVGNTEIIGDKVRFPRITRISTSMQGGYMEIMILLMRQYGWDRVVIFNDEGSGYHELTGKSADVVFENNKNISWKRYALNNKEMTREDYKRYLVTSRVLARVIVILAGSDTTREFMLAAHELGYTDGQFAYFSLISPNLNLTVDAWKQNDTEDQAARQAFESVIYLNMASDRVAEGFNSFQQTLVTYAQERYNYTYDSPPSSSLLRYYETVILYARVLNETLTEGGDPKDGYAISRRMWNRTYEGVTGPLVLNENGDRVSDIAIWDLDPATGVPEIIYIYRSDTRKMEVINSRGIVWLNGKGPPLNEPVCGYVDEKCDFTEEADQTPIFIVAGVFAVLVLVALVVFILQYRRWRRISEANLWWWKISPDDLIINNLPLTGSIISMQSMVQRANGGPGSTDNASIVSYAMETGLFKSQQVRLRKLMIQNPIVNRDVLREFKLMRELVAPNLVRVLGACLDNSSPVLVTELCPKGSLQDLIGSVNTMTLDADFKISLANDISQGLGYLHQCPLGHHGSLSSANCLIDNRFTVKLADYSPKSLLYQENIDKNDQEYKRACLWKAPEILRGDVPSEGTKEGDVYSFGIIVAELVNRASPFEKETAFLTLDDILTRLKNPEVAGNVFRPSVDVTGVTQKFKDILDIMEAAWREDPHVRPTAIAIQKQIKHISLKSGQSANLLDNLLRRMERYANNLEKLVEEKTEELQIEKKKSDELLFQILPKHIANRLRCGLPVDPEQYDCVTIYFSDIVGFTTLSGKSTPMQVIDLLNDLYSAFDECISAFDVYKVETIGDAYMVVSGLTNRSTNLHAQQIARMSLALLSVISVFRIKHKPDEKMQLRIGMNSGPVCAGVVGVKMPRYCLFGDTVNTASRMESNGEGMKVHVSPSTMALLETFGTFDIIPRGDIEIKGKGKMTTYWLLGERTTPVIDVKPDVLPERQSPFTPPPVSSPTSPPSGTQQQH